MKNLHSVRGLTLIELMSTLAIMSVLVGFAVPSFIGLIRTNALTQQVNGFGSAISLARSEAIKRSEIVRICLRAADDSCSLADGTNWSLGWIVYADENNDGTLDDGEAIRYFDPLGDIYTLTANDIGANEIAYDRQGRLILPELDNFNMRLCAANALPAGDTEYSRTLNFNTIGRVTPTKGADTCP